VLVTGAASGLGAALTDAFLSAGDLVLATDREAFDGRPSDGLLRQRLDVTSEEDWVAARTRVADEWGGLDVLVNNAGVAGGGRIDVCTLDEWAWIADVNLFGVVRGCRTFAPVLKSQASGRIVNVASLAGLVHPPGMASYNAVKAAVVALSETLAHELAPYGVGCSVVCPSYFRSNLVGAMRGSDEDVAAKVGEMVATSSLTAEEIAAEVLGGIEEGLELIVPDEPARAAYQLKRAQPTAYSAEMRRTATRLKERADA
jgi:NAD(P)-dependent dehydrogenase (short-subunit alcohol dehydrogenase family)